MADDDAPKTPRRRTAAAKPAEATEAKPPRARAAAKKDDATAAPRAPGARAKKPQAAADAKPARTRAKAAEASEPAKPARTRAKAAAEATPKAAAETKAAPAARRSRATAEAAQPEPAPTPPPAAAPAPSPRARRAAPLGPVTVRARARYVRSSARKARLVCDHIRGKSVPEARALLQFAPRGVARDWAKLLASAVANAENNHELVADELHVTAVYADEGPTLKRFTPRARGRATPIHKRTSHLTIELGRKE